MKKKAIIIFSIVLFIFVLNLFATLASLESRRKGVLGYIQQSWLKVLQEDMEKYHDIHHTYPPVGESCSNILVLENYTTKPDSFREYKELLARKKSINEIILDKMLQQGFLSSSQRPFLEDVLDYDFRVSVGGDGSKYILRSGGDFDSRWLQEDLDGKILGCDCNDPYYCVE